MKSLVTILGYISFVISYLPTVIKVVKYVEQAYSETDGKKKKELALIALDEALNLSGLPEEKQKDIINFLSGLIDTVVAFLNLKKTW